LKDWINWFQMVDLKASNLKLQQRSRDIVRMIVGPSHSISDQELDGLIAKCDGSVKIAVASISLGLPANDASKRLQEAGGVLAHVLNDPHRQVPDALITNGTSVGDYVLSVDGGGSKCAAVLLGTGGEEGRGEAGGGNVSVLVLVAVWLCH
jgi:N-acetylmuramic acid 6-phosphate etherase